MADYRVQIIIPVYNSSKTLKKCLDSLISQTCTCWQAIVVDDKSKDNSLEILNEYAKADKRFRIIAAPKNGGSSAARNLALDYADGEYVAFLDSDDYWEDDMLETLLDRADKYGCDVVQCRFIYDFSGGKHFLPTGAFKNDIYLEGRSLKKVYRRMMTGINMNHVCMKLIKTSLAGDTRFDITYRTAEDLDFCVRLFKGVGKYYFSSKPMYHYCRWENSITGKGLPFSVRLDANRRVSKTMLAMLPHWGADNLFYKVLTLLRPYIIIISKVFRVFREKLMTK